jgi:hypothetical protein
LKSPNLTVSGFLLYWRPEFMARRLAELPQDAVY